MHGTSYHSTGSLDAGTEAPSRPVVLADQGARLAFRLELANSPHFRSLTRCAVGDCAVRQVLHGDNGGKKVIGTPPRFQFFVRATFADINVTAMKQDAPSSQSPTTAPRVQVHGCSAVRNDGPVRWQVHCSRQGFAWSLCSHQAKAGMVGDDTNKDQSTPWMERLPFFLRMVSVFLRSVVELFRRFHESG
jgi:hypothetical protein